MSRCAHCTSTARYQVTGANYDGPVLACDGHLGRVQRDAGAPRSTVAIEDDGQDALFDVPEVKPKRGNLR